MNCISSSSSSLSIVPEAAAAGVHCDANLSLGKERKKQKSLFSFDSYDLI